MFYYYTIVDLEMVISDEKSEQYDCSLEKDISDQDCVDISADGFCDSDNGKGLASCSLLVLVFV